MMDSFQCLATSPISIFNLVSDVAIAVFFGKLSRGTIRRASNLRAQLEFFVRGPRRRDRADFKMEVAKFLVDLQIFHTQIICHTSRNGTVFFPPEP